MEDSGLDVMASAAIDLSNEEVVEMHIESSPFGKDDFIFEYSDQNYRSGWFVVQRTNSHCDFNRHHFILNGL